MSGVSTACLSFSTVFQIVTSSKNSRGNRRDARKSLTRINRQFRRVEVKIRRARRRARVMPFAIVMPCRHQCKLLRDVAQRRPRQTVDICFAVAAHSLLICNKQVERRMKRVVGPFLRSCFDVFNTDTAPHCPATRNRPMGCDIHPRRDQRLISSRHVKTCATVKARPPR